jgi:hypothetical protein
MNLNKRKKNKKEYSFLFEFLSSSNYYVVIKNIKT